MKVLSFKFLLPALLVVGLPIALLYLITADQAAVPRAALTEDQLANIQQLLIDKDPKLLLERNAQSLHLTEGEVNALLTYFLHNVPELRDVAGRVSLDPGSAKLEVSTPVSALPFHEHLNLELSVVERDSRLAIDNLAVGRLNIPGALVEPLVSVSRPLLQRQENYRLLSSVLETVTGVSLADGGLDLQLNWREEDLANIGRQAQRILIDEAERERLFAYYAGIGEIARAFPEGQSSARLSEFFRPLFLSASARSDAGADPVAENRALFIAMSVYVNGIAMDNLAEPPADVMPPRRLTVKVGPREDLAQHIVTSAAIAASAGAGVADILSIYKEVHDSRYRTGFSFSDLTANQVGATLGQLATRDATDARRVQDYLATSVDEADYMPPVARFDGISEQEFINQYQDRSSDHYRERLREIDAAIAMRPLFQAIGQ